MTIFSKLAIIGVIGMATVLPATAASAEPCGQDQPYCFPVTPQEGSQDSGVLPATAEQTPPAAAVNAAPAAAEAPAPAVAAPAAAPSGALPFTGGDVVGMTVIGAGALGLGSLMVRRSKKAKASA